MFSKYEIGIAIAGIAAASFTTGFISAEQVLDHQTKTAIAQPLQPALYNTAQLGLWQGDIGLRYVNNQVQLARQQSAIAQTQPFTSHHRSSSYTDEPSWPLSHRANQSPASSASFETEDAIGESSASISDPGSESIEATASGDALSPTSTSPIDRSHPGSSTFSTDHHADGEPNTPSLKPDFSWPSSPAFAKNHIKTSQSNPILKNSPEI